MVASAAGSGSAQAQAPAPSSGKKERSWATVWTAVASLLGVLAFAWNVALAFNPDIPEAVGSLVRRLQLQKVEDLAVGDCVNVEDIDPPVPNGSRSPELGFRVVSCNARHLVEVIGVAVVPSRADDPWEGQDRAVELLFPVCSSAAKAVVAKPLQGKVRVAMYGPSEKSWDEGDRMVVCIVYEDRIGSVVERPVGVSTPKPGKV
ncbi:hypothetical protein GCM10009721_11250 [Terrabacter tumescens]|uniref:Septum formation-related domain-containing protein n=1 Tax=Terrabacter tumescens TaxID=60443 RepID=A0ABQ2HRP0_9MICO|nr:septum formation family protein [Terrabacter tumescens]GGM88006.1 hypothetical protein GCM10009721_11250 [Terrabacter tumescens]